MRNLRLHCSNVFFINFTRNYVVFTLYTMHLHCASVKFLFLWLPAEPAFPCGDDNNNNISGFGLLIFSAGGGRSARVGGFGLLIFPAGGGRSARVGGFGLLIFPAGGGRSARVGGFGLLIFRFGLPAEPAFPCGDDNNNNSTNSTNTGGFIAYRPLILSSIILVIPRSFY